MNKKHISPKRQPFSRILVCTAVLWMTPVSAQTKVVVIPLGDDVKQVKPFSPLAPDSPSLSNYIIKTKTVFDKTTALEWQKVQASLNDTTGTWTSAKTYCASLSLDGKTDWRLPDINELISIAFYNSSISGINPFVFPNANINIPYWSATPNTYTGAWTVKFFDGSVATEPIDSLFPNDINVRCVRDGG